MNSHFTSRRTVLKWMGISLALPLLESVIPNLSFGSGTRKRFIGVYFPNGAHMPNATNGSWIWSDALKPLVDRGLKDNVMIVRNLFNGFYGIDPHWQNVAGFLSCRKIILGDPGVAKCGKSFDQYVADKYVGSIRSLEIGGLYYYIHPLNDHAGYSHDYVNRICWQTPDKFRTPIADPRELFNQVFATNQRSVAAINYLHARKKSILDYFHTDAKRVASRLPASYKPVLEAYEDSVREVENKLNSVTPQCTISMTEPTQNAYSGPNNKYIERMDLLQKIVVLAFECGVTNASTIMYGPGVSHSMTYIDSLSNGAGHHDCAHHGDNPDRIQRLKQMNQVQVELLARLLADLKSKNLLGDTLVYYGSDMSDGNIHSGDNLPLLVCGQGNDLKFGQEIVPTRRPVSDLFMEMSSLMGIPMTSFGEGELLSTGPSLGIRK